MNDAVKEHFWKEGAADDSSIFIFNLIWKLIHNEICLF